MLELIQQEGFFFSLYAWFSNLESGCGSAMALPWAKSTPISRNVDSVVSFSTNSATVCFDITLAIPLMDWTIA